jgi:hypothetical protein
MRARIAYGKAIRNPRSRSWPMAGDAPCVTDEVKNTTLQRLTEFFTFRMSGPGNAFEGAGAP